jgi:hypothetical protein
MASGTLIEPEETSARSNQSGREPDYRCDCGHVLRVSGGGRHRVYFRFDDARLNDPVMNRVCPACGLGLPGKNQP